MGYAIVIETAGGNYSAYVPDLPGCVATGPTVETVETEICHAIQFHIDGLAADGLPIPPPTTIAKNIDKDGEQSEQIGPDGAAERLATTISATAVRFDDDMMWVDLSDGRTLGIPLAWFPRLLRASPEARQRVEIGRMGLHWEELDEDISIAGLLAGRGDMTRQPKHAA